MPREHEVQKDQVERKSDDSHFYEDQDHLIVRRAGVDAAQIRRHRREASDADSSQGIPCETHRQAALPKLQRSTSVPDSVLTSVTRCCKAAGTT